VRKNERSGAKNGEDGGLQTKFEEAPGAFDSLRLAKCSTWNTGWGENPGTPQCGVCLTGFSAPIFSPHEPGLQSNEGAPPRPFARMAIRAQNTHLMWLYPEEFDVLVIGGGQDSSFDPKPGYNRANVL
jgi:hypothetical protein